MSGCDYHEEVRDLDLAPSLKSPDIKDKWQKLSEKLDILVKSVIADLSGRRDDEGEKFSEYPEIFGISTDLNPRNIRIWI